MSFDTVLTVPTNGITTAYSEVGIGEPLIIVMGGAAENCERRRLIPYIANGIRTISYDPRDFGLTVSREEPYTLETLADDAVAFMNILGLTRAHLMGWSSGGMVAFEIAHRHPKRVQSLIIGAMPYSCAEMPASIRNLAGLSHEAQAQLMLDMCLTPKGQANKELVAQLIGTDAARRRRPDGTVGARRNAALSQHDMTGRTKKIFVPTLLIYGAQDPMAPPEIGRRLKHEITGSQLVVHEGRHGFVLEFPAEMAKLVSEWVLNHPVGN